MIKNFYTILTALCLCLFSYYGNALTATIGTGTSVPAATLYGPIYRASAASTITGSKCNMVWTQAELAAAGIINGSTISAIRFNKANDAHFLIPATFSVYMRNSSTVPALLTTTTWASIPPAYTQVFTSTTYDVPATAGWVTITLNAPFNYTGGSIEIATECTMTGGTTGATNYFQWYFTSGFATSIVGVASATGTTLNGTATANKERPNLQLEYTPPASCSGTPVAGTATADNSGTICPNTAVILNLTGNTIGNGITYEWEASPTLTPFVPTSLGSPATSAPLTVNPTATTYYRAIANCTSGSFSYSSIVQVNVATAFPGGVYTINPALPASATNFQSFAAAIDAIHCGISGPVEFNTAPNSGPYNELFSIGNIQGASAINTIRFNGNGNTLQYTNTASNRQLLTLNGAKYVTIDSFTFKALDTAYGWGAIVTNSASFDSITHCTFDLANLTSTGTANCVGIAFTASLTSATTTGTNGSNCYIGSNKFRATNGSGGFYYGLTVAGASNNNVFENNEIENFYYYGAYVNAATGTQLIKNNFHRTNKTTVTSFYGLYTTGAVPNTLIYGNKFHDMGGGSAVTSTAYPIYLTGDATVGQPCNVINNVIYNISTGGVIYGIYIPTASNINLYHNTIAFNAVTTGTSAQRGIYTTGTNENLTVVNNIIAVTGGNQGIKHGLYYATAASIFSSHHNDVYLNSSQTGAQSYGYLTSDYATLAAFQAGNPTLENSSISENPQLAAPASGNLAPTSYLVYGLGQNLTASVPFDINGTTRPNPPTPGAVEMPAPPMNNAGMMNLINPTSALCSGTYPIEVSFVNAGYNVINTLQLKWSINGVLQTPYNYTGPLYSATNANAQSVDTAVIGNITMAAGSQNIVKVWTSNPNNVADTDPSNDTLTFTLYAAMNGTYTINPLLPASITNYQTITSFSNALTARGVCGPVVANINAAAGPYTEAISFGSINGTSNINTVKINGHGAQVNYNCDANIRQLLTLSNAKYIKIDSLNFKTLSATYGWAANIFNGSTRDSITNCTFDLSSITNATSANSSGICFSGSLVAATTAGANSTNCYIGHNKLIGTTGNYAPYYGITLMSGCDSNIIDGNEFANFYYYGIYNSAAKFTQILNNEVHRKDKTSTTVMYGMYITGTCDGVRITGNRIHTPGGTTGTGTGSVYAIYCTADGTATNKILIANNLIYNINQGGLMAGVYCSSTLYADVIHNTIDLSAIPNNTSTSGVYGFYFSGTNTGTRALNNIVNLTGGTLGTKYGIYVSTAASISDAQRNNIYVNSTQTGTQSYGYYTAATATLAAFQTAAPTLEIGSVSVAPQFAMPSQQIYLPLNPALTTAGSNQQASVPKDILGYDRTTTPTPGAFEYTSSYNNNAGTTALVTPSGNFCSGPRPVQVTVKNYGANDITSMQIHWKLNGVTQPVYNFTGLIDDLYSGNNTATLTIGTGNFPFGTPSQIVVWTVQPNGATDYANDNDTLTATVQPGYQVVINLGNDSAVCNGNAITLDAGHPGATYLWSNGATTQTTSLNSNGQYYVTVTEADGCKGADTFNYNAIPLPVVNLGNDTTVCPGVTLTLNAANPGATYLWNNGSTTQTVVTGDTGTFSVTVTSNTCFASDAITIAHIAGPHADGINATYSDSATYMFEPINPQFSQTYIWNFGDGSPEATGLMVQHTYTQNSIYTVTCTLTGLCDGTTLPVTRTVDVFDAGGSTGITTPDNARNWTVYPNPSNGLVTIENKSDEIIRKVEVLTITGQRMLATTTNAAKVTLNTGALASGVYILKAETSKGNMMIKKIEIRK